MARFIRLLAVFLILSFPALPVFSAQAPGSVSGIVRWSDGTPSAGARVTAIVTTADGLLPTHVWGTRIAGTALTDNTGNYRMENLPSGMYHIVTGPVSLPRTFSDVAMTGSPHLVSVTSGKTAENVNFTTVRNSEGAPYDPAQVLTITGKIVMKSPAGTEGIHIVVTNTDGTVSRWQFRPDDNHGLWWWPGYDAGPRGEIDKMSKSGEIVTITGTDSGGIGRTGVRVLRVTEVTRGGIPQSN